MASLYSRTYKQKRTGKTVTYWYVAYIRDGKRRAKCAGTSKSVANELKKHIEAELRIGKFDFLNQPGGVRIEDSISTYLGQAKNLRKPATYMRSRCALSHLSRFLDARLPSLQLVRSLSIAHFDEYKSWRRTDPITPNGSVSSKKVKYPTFRTINNEVAVFRAWINWAVAAKHIGENPLSGFEKLKTTDSKPRRSLTRKELAKLLAASVDIEQEKPGRVGQTKVWQFLASTGLRIGELIHLQWKDIDSRRKVIKIQRKPNWDPKTYGREVPFTPGAADVLRQLRKRSRDGEAYVFLTTRGKPYRENKARDWILDCAKHAHIKDMRGPHDLRHTFITMALTEFNMPVPAVQTIVGHTKLETTQAYLHPTTDFIRSVAQKFEL